MTALTQEIVDVGAMYWRASVQGGWLVLGVLLAQRALRPWLSPAWQHGLWLLVLVRLTVPYAPPSALSWENLGPSLLPRLTARRIVEPPPPAEVPSPAQADPAPETTTRKMSRPGHFSGPESAPDEGGGKGGFRSGGGVEGAGGDTVATTGRDFWRRWALGGWLVGILVFAARLVVANGWFGMQARRAVKIQDPAILALVAECRRSLGVRREVSMWESGLVTNPCLFGAWSPTVLFPVGLVTKLSAEELRHVILHELAHVRRRDLWWQAWFDFVTCVHWFNPLAWLAAARCRQDRELACDALVLETVGETSAPAYGRTILKLVTGRSSVRSVVAAAGILENHAELRRRIAMIGSFGRRRGSGVLAVAVGSVLAACGWTGRVGPETWVGFKPLDLTANSDHPSGPAQGGEGYMTVDPPGTWLLAPTGLQEFQGVPFSVDGLIRLAGQMVQRNGWNFRPTSGEIPVDQQFGRLYLLHATYYGAPESEPVSRIWFHYADGRREQLDIRYGDQVRNWHRQKHDYPVNLRDPDSRVVWTGQAASNAEYGKSLRLIVSSLRNPRPSVAVRSIELVSAFGQATHVVLGMTVGGTELPRAWKRQPKVDEPEHPPTERLMVQALDAATGQPLAGYQLDFEASQEQSHFILGRFVTDASGRAELRYPKGEFRSCDIWARREGYVSKIIHWETRERGPFPAEYIYRAETGQRIGARLVDTAGKPVANATVEIRGPAPQFPDGVVETLALDYAFASTDADGRWEYRGVPKEFQDLLRLSVRIQHPGHPALLSTAAEAVGDATWILAEPSRGPAVRGRVVDARGRGLPGATVGVLPYRSTLRGVMTDAEGRFVIPTGAAAERLPGLLAPHGPGPTVLPESDEAMSMVVVASGYAPTVLPVTREAVTNEVRLVVDAGRTVSGRVIDADDRPVAGATLGLESWSGRLPVRGMIRTDRRGRFTWDHAPSGLFTLKVAHPEHLPVLLSIDSAPASGPWVAQLKPQARLEFAVISARDRQPIPHGRVWMQSEDADGVFEVAGVVNEGRCVLRLPARGLEVLFRVESPGYAPSTVKVALRSESKVVKVMLLGGDPR